MVHYKVMITQRNKLCTWKTLVNMENRTIEFLKIYNEVDSLCLQIFFHCLRFNSLP